MTLHTRLERLEREVTGGADHGSSLWIVIDADPGHPTAGERAVVEDTIRRERIAGGIRIWEGTLEDTLASVRGERTLRNRVFED
jgi:hypothetical protein